MPPFWQLCEQGKLEEVKRALNNGEDVNDSGDVGVTALMSAICNGDKSVVPGGYEWWSAADSNAVRTGTHTNRQET